MYGSRRFLGSRDSVESGHSRGLQLVHVRQPTVRLRLSQGALKSSNQAWNVLTPRPGGNNLAYAWDEPTLEHKLLVHVRVFMRPLHPSRFTAPSLSARLPVPLKLHL